jgi:TatD family-associated radical SAM protein
MCPEPEKSPDRQPRRPRPAVAGRLAYVIRDSLYLNVTDRCTLACRFCPKHQNDDHRVHGMDLSLARLPTASEVIDAIGRPDAYREIVFCGFGEPTLRLKLVLEIARYVKDQGATVRLNTDGLANRVHKRNVLPDMQGLIDAVSVSMNAQNREVYDRHCRPALADSFEAMLAFMRLAPRYIPSVTATAIAGLDGVDIEACERLAHECGVGFRRRELDVVG